MSDLARIDRLHAALLLELLRRLEEHVQISAMQGNKCLVEGVELTRMLRALITGQRKHAPLDAAPGEFMTQRTVTPRFEWDLDKVRTDPSEAP